MTDRNDLPGSLRSLLLYIVLVGLPLVGVLGIVYLGERLEAPASVKGQWQIEVEGKAPDPQDCSAGLRSALALMIVQSGPDLRITFNDEAQTTMIGHINGFLVTASESSGPLALEATLDQLSQATRLRGTLTFSACDQHMNWSATRVPSAK